LVETLQAAQIGAALVADAEDLCLRDPQLIARGAWTRLTTPEGRSVTLDAALPRLSDTPGRITAAAPLAGEHTDEILQQIVGLPPSDIARLRNAGVVA
jgi:crotonobetainyl-CoA:carnitine CoA-transferase CaiB-like acyl-CoA transferase